MFFLVRSALCIGLVVAALPGFDRGALAHRTLAGLRTQSTRIAAMAAEQMCAAQPGRCLAAVNGNGGGAPVHPSRTTPIPVSRDTLTAADRRPSWSGRLVASSE